MKPDAEMHEGPEALTRFEDAMRKLFSAKKRDLPPNPFGNKKKPAQASKADSFPPADK